ncbi:glutaminase [Pseudanabaena yagii]|uniref:glutaminase n=1 Tax=Pseudanabaena yagii GIHE-NHR1 TaxID=2722753 RepID=A0ABX1LVJ2_9CYAN|nr:glutaminase [Pseudanabaena yagii]NMF59278.1 glutaminase A [Pseudanabaena yagii GIHE-NHR1]
MLDYHLQKLLDSAKKEIFSGKLPNYIPLLAQVNPQAISIAINQLNSDGKFDMTVAGNTQLTFPLMSVIKPFLLLYLLEIKGINEIFGIVDRQSTSVAFNAIPEGKPANPMINSGAIAISSLLPSYEALQIWLNQQSGANLSLDREMLASVRSVANRRNLAIASQLQSLGIIPNPNHALNVYEEICCLRGNVQDLAKIGTLLLNTNINTNKSPNIEIVLEIMTQCGMYGASAEFAQDIGLPSKSSVSGALLSIIPERAAIACYSPALDAIGNSVAGIFLLKNIKSYLL